MTEHERMNIPIVTPDIMKDILREEWEKDVKELTHMINDYDRLKAENERYRKALEWYANSDNYLFDDYTLASAWSMNKNIEKKARKALKPKE